MKLRAPTLDDLPELAVFFEQLHQYGTGGASEAELRDWFTNEMLDPELDFRAAFVDGGIVGWCDVWDRDRSGQCFWLDVRAHPRVEATYETLLEFGLQRTREQAGEDAVARVLVAPDDEALAGSARRRAFRPVRYAFRMEMDLVEELARPRWPEGISVRSYRAEEARTVYELESEIFAADWNFTKLDFADWCRLYLGSTEFDPRLWFVAESASEVVGLALCRSERRPEVGHIGVLGVKPGWRGRGLGLALLLHSSAELRAHGRSRVDLGVDAENTTGALRLYERAGMRVAERTDTYEKALS